MRAAERKSLPRLLVTGFEPFPGVPVNPTAWLVGRLRAAPPRNLGVAAFRAQVLPVDYREIGPRLSEIGKSFAPDIAIHFGLARECRGFRLERFACNAFACAPADNRGFAPPDGPICAGPPTIASTLPLDAIHEALAANGLPVEWSDNAGGYLCNVAMTLSLGLGCADFAPAMSGFVHVPLVGGGRALSQAGLLAGAGIILATTLAAWPGVETNLDGRESAAPPAS